MTEAKMQESIEYKPGTFCWVELGTTDGEAAKKFYTQLFDWDFTDNPVGPGGVYTILKQNGKDVGALYQMPSEMTSNGVPPHWMSYISVANADESAAKAKSLGATLMKEPFDVYTMGRMAVIQDPTGAMFALWQPGTHQGAGIVNTPNSLCWKIAPVRPKVATFRRRIWWDKNVQIWAEDKHVVMTGSPSFCSISGTGDGRCAPHDALLFRCRDRCHRRTRHGTWRLNLRAGHGSSGSVAGSNADPQGALLRYQVRKIAV